MPAQLPAVSNGTPLRHPMLLHPATLAMTELIWAALLRCTPKLDHACSLGLTEFNSSSVYVCSSYQVWDVNTAKSESEVATTATEVSECTRRGVAAIPTHCGFIDVASGAGLGFGSFDFARSLCVRMSVHSKFL